MTALDWAVLLVGLVALAYGAIQGLMASGLGLLGFGLGAFFGARYVPSIIGGEQNEHAATVGLAAGLIVGFLLGGILRGLGSRLRSRLRSQVSNVLDAALGAAFALAVATATMWLLSAMVLQASNLPRSWHLAVSKSSLLREIRRELPPASGVLAMISTFDPLPGLQGPAARVEAPDSRVLRYAGVARARQSVVRVQGEACGLGVVGTGWAVGSDYIVTNQHVIAGEQSTTVIPEAGGGSLSAYVAYANSSQDLAILEVPGLNLRPLVRVANPTAGTEAAVLGYPKAGPFRARSARIDSEVSAIGQDSYGNPGVRRLMLPFRGLVQQGNSGGPLVNRKGQVLGTVFASSLSSKRNAGYAVSNKVLNEAIKQLVRGRRVSTGACGH